MEKNRELQEAKSNHQPDEEPPRDSVTVSFEGL
jgi:hypothetical protein